jgi:hypothetical protein
MRNRSSFSRCSFSAFCKRTGEAEIWEIILRDFWGDILRALLTRALNLCPIALHKSSIIYD